MKYIYYYALLAIITACNGTVGTHNHQHEEDDETNHNTSSEEIVIEPEKAAKLGISIIKTKSEPFNSVIRVSGRIEKDNSNSWDIIANRSGKITFLKKYLTIGCQINNHENLFGISSEDLNNNNYNAELEKFKAELELAESQYTRIENLRKEMLATENEYDEARKNYEIARANFRRVSNAISLNIRAPHQGFIISLNVKNGQYVEEGSTIATISSGKEIIIEADIPARYSSQIKNIVGANYSFDGQIYSAGEQISSSDIVSDRGTIIPVHFRSEKFDGITAGIPVEVIVKLSDTRNTIFLPKSSITEKYGKYYVYEKIDEDCYREVEVSLGESDGINIEITSPIEEGIDIVSEGVYYVKMAGTSSSIPHGHSH